MLEFLFINPQVLLFVIEPLFINPQSLCSSWDEHRTSFAKGVCVS